MPPFLVIVARMTPHPHLVGVTTLLQTGVVEFSTPVKRPLQLFSCALVRREAILVRFDAHSWSAFVHERARCLPPCSCDTTTLYTVILAEQASSGTIAKRVWRSSFGDT